MPSSATPPATRPRRSSPGPRPRRTFGGDFSWAHRAGSFNELLLEAGDVNRVEDFEEADAQAKMIVGFVNDVVSLAKLPPGVGIVVDHGVDALGASLAPSEEELVRDNNRAHAILENGLTASIVQGYADNGLIDLGGAEELGLVEDGRLVPYNELDGIARGRFEEWMNNDPDVSRVIREAIQEAKSVRAGTGAALLAAATLALGGCGGDDNDEALAACRTEAENAAQAAVLADAYRPRRARNPGRVLEEFFTPADRTRLFDAQGRMVPYRELPPRTRARFDEYRGNAAFSNDVRARLAAASEEVREAGYPGC